MRHGLTESFQLHSSSHWLRSSELSPSLCLIACSFFLEYIWLQYRQLYLCCASTPFWSASSSWLIKSISADWPRDPHWSLKGDQYQYQAKRLDNVFGFMKQFLYLIIITLNCKMCLRANYSKIMLKARWRFHSLTVSLL